MNSLDAIKQKVRDNVRLSEEDALYLYEQTDLLDLGHLADEANRARNGRDVFYNVNRHINPTNVCAKNCKFCAFSRKPGDEGAYEYSIDEILAKAREVLAQGATEVHMVGGLHPRWRFDHYLDILGAIKSNFPSLHIKAFTAVEIDWLAAKARLSIADTLLKLKEAGLGSMPGGGAEIFHPEVRMQICDTKTTAERWIDIHRTAHRMGLRSNCTMLYGHIEKPWHRVDHMRRLRELQDETKGFNIFIPLAFQPQDNDMGISRYTAGPDDLRTIAVARLYLDNFQHIKAYWIMLGQDIAQLALNFGANDLDGTVTEEKISRMAGGRSGMSMGKAFIHSLIRKADRVPVERDTLYHPVWRDTKEQVVDEQKAETRRQSSMLLYKFGHSEPLSSQDFQTLAQSAGLLELAHAARRGKSSDSRLVAQPSPIAFVDLASELMVNEIKTATDLKQYLKAQRITRVKGMKRLWQLGQFDALTPVQWFSALKLAGVESIESSSWESEEDLTNSEIVSLHHAAHTAGIRSAAKLELNTSFDGQTHVFWHRFLERATALRDLHVQTEGLAAICIDVAPSCLVTPAEYLRGVALARLVFTEIPGSYVRIIAPFAKIPTIKTRATHYADALSDPAFKIAPLAVMFGADDFGDLAAASDEDRKYLVAEAELVGVKSTEQHSGRNSHQQPNYA